MQIPRPSPPEIVIHWGWVWLCHPLLLLPPVPPSIRVFSNESTLRTKWPKYWSFSFSIIPPKEIPGLISFRMVKNFPQFVVIHTGEGFSVVNEAQVDVFLELSQFFYDPTDVGNLISGSSAFSKSSLNIRKFMVHILLKPCLKEVEPLPC